MESETILMNIWYSDIVKSINLSYISRGHFSNAGIGHLENIALLTYTDLSNVNIFDSKIQVVPFVTISTDLIRKVLSIVKP